MNRDGFPGAVHAIGASADRREHAGRVASSRTVDIAEHAGGGAVPGSAGTVITSGARGIDECTATRKGSAQAAEGIEKRQSLATVIVRFLDS